jgi:hypothetical protein
MSLQLIKTVSPVIEYKTYTSFPFGAHYFPTKPGGERLKSISHFYYEPSHDLLVAWVIFDQDPWPGWGTARFTWKAEDGSLVERGPGTVNNWTCHGIMGSYNKIYMTWNSGTSVTEVAWDTLRVPAGGFFIDPHTWNPARIFRYAVVNREDGLIAGVQDWFLEIWDISGTPSRRAQMRLPYTLGYMCWESRHILWIITSTGIICKADYRRNPPRWEMMSQVQDPSPDATNYFIAFDTRRNRVVVLRQRPDAGDGACQCQLEFYWPLVKILALTGPVPVGRHRAGDITEFVAHLYGDAGEGVPPFVVRAALTAPAQGTLLKPESTSGVNGAVSFLYQCPAVVGQEEISISAEINDGTL